MLISGAGSSENVHYFFSTSFRLSMDSGAFWSSLEHENSHFHAILMVSQDQEVALEGSPHPATPIFHDYLPRALENVREPSGA